MHEKLEQEYIRYGHYLNTIEDAKSIIFKFANILSKIEYEDYAFEITPSVSIRFKFILSKERKLFVTKNLMNSNLLDHEVFFTLFFDNELLVSDIKDVHELIEGINKFTNN